MRNDGKVVATGDNGDGKCNVSGWNDITAIFASRTHSVGLKKDGTVVATGSYNNDVTAWQNIKAVSACYGFTMGVKQDGSVVSTKNPADYASWGGIKELVVYGSDVAGLRENGTVASNAYQNAVQSWTGITSVAAGYDHIVGLRQDGTVITAGYNGSGQCNVSEWTNITSIAAGASYTVGLKSNGTVLTAGANNYRQRNTGTWNLYRASSTPPAPATFAPQADKKAGTYVDAVKVKLESATAGATIYYTTNGKSPTKNSTALKNGGTITFRKTTTLKYFASYGADNSPVITSKYSIQTVRPDSNALPLSKTVKRNSTITLKAPSGCTLYYTTNGKSPTTSSSKIASGSGKNLTISSTTTVKAMMVKSGCTKSEIVTAKYTVG